VNSGPFGSRGDSGFDLSLRFNISRIGILIVLVVMRVLEVVEGQICSSKAKNLTQMRLKLRLARR
jgi:hypothetical protein